MYSKEINAIILDASFYPQNGTFKAILQQKM
jgi:hypothetical protein